jgi:predicted GIY-YIG superfamily endonuclease
MSSRQAGMTSFVEGSAVENLLRLHHGEPVVEPVHRHHEQPLSPHKYGDIDGFTKRYNINRLVYYEVFHSVGCAIAREKKIKSWTRTKRLALIKSRNPTWQDLAEGWGEGVELKIRKELQIPRQIE